MAAKSNDRFSFHVISISAKICKTTFPMEFVKIWLIIGDHEYIITAERENLIFFTVGFYA